MLLAIDTSTRVVGIALYDGVKVVSERVWLSQQYHTVELAPTVSGIINQVGIAVDDLKAVAVAIGPGSFTGLRIGLALAKGMALAGRLAVIGIPSLDILAASQPIDNHPLAAIIQAGRGRIAVGWYKNYSGEWKADSKIQVMTPRELAIGINSPTIVCGELAEDEQRLFKRKRINVILASPAQSLRRPSFLAELGWRRWQKGMFDDAAALTPEYLHYDQNSSA